TAGWTRRLAVNRDNAVPGCTKRVENGHGKFGRAHENEVERHLSSYLLTRAPPLWGAGRTHGKCVGACDPLRGVDRMHENVSAHATPWGADHTRGSPGAADHNARATARLNPAL